MTDEQLKKLHQVEATLDRVVDGFVKLSDTIAKHGEILKAFQKELDQLGTAAISHQSSLVDLSKLPDQMNVIAVLVDKHQRVLERLTGRSGPEVVN